MDVDARIDANAMVVSIKVLLPESGAVPAGGDVRVRLPGAIRRPVEFIYIDRIAVQDMPRRAYDLKVQTSQAAQDVDDHPGSRFFDVETLSIYAEAYVRVPGRENRDPPGADLTAA